MKDMNKYFVAGSTLTYINNINATDKVSYTVDIKFRKFHYEGIEKATKNEIIKKITGKVADSCPFIEEDDYDYFKNSEIKQNCNITVSKTHFNNLNKMLSEIINKDIIILDIIHTNDDNFDEEWNLTEKQLYNQFKYVKFDYINSMFNNDSDSDSDNNSNNNIINYSNNKADNFEGLIVDYIDKDLLVDKTVIKEQDDDQYYIPDNFPKESEFWKNKDIHYMKDNEHEEGWKNLNNDLCCKTQ